MPRAPGDNMAAAVGLAVGPGDVVVSPGTSGTAFAVSTKAAPDSTGNRGWFADATGQFLPLVRTLNAARVLTATARTLGIDLADLDALAGQAEPGAGSTGRGVRRPRCRPACRLVGQRIRRASKVGGVRPGEDL